MIKYDRLWKKMEERGESTYTLRFHYGISGGTITQLRRNEAITTNTLDILCEILDCKVEDILEYVPNPEPRQFPKDKDEPIY